MILAKEFEGELWIKAAHYDREVKRLLDTIDELRDSEFDRNVMFGEGYNYALDHIREAIKSKVKL
jgi:hypothetical protein